MKRRRAEGEAGQGLAEFALVLPVLLLVMMGILDFGRAVFAYNSLSNAARDGARVAIVDQTISGGIPAGAQEAANQATGLGLNPAADVTVTYTVPGASTAACVAIGCEATVEARYRFTAITPIIGNIVGPINLAATTTMTIEFTKP